jgi:ubiquinone/menaquinone biosynthesis C-methylase UbiE
VTKTATTVFDELAPDYSRLWTDTESGMRQRWQVWRQIDTLFQAGDSVLDLGCGIGDDALHLSERGIEVCAIDASEKMAEIARSRGLMARRLKVEDLGRLTGPFSGAISNFGVLNCVPGLRVVAEELRRLVQPGGALALCVMGRFAPVETLQFLAKLDWRNAIRRWSGQATWRGVDVFYHSSADMRKAFTNGFAFEDRISIGWGDHQLYIFRRRQPW